MSTITVEPWYPSGVNTFRVKYSSDAVDPTFTIYRDGKFLKTTKETELDIYVEKGEGAVLDITDDDSDPEEAYSGTAIFGWNATPATDYYKIEEYFESAWVERAQVVDDDSGYFTWESRFLEDVTIHEFKITPVGDNGNEGTAIEPNIFMVRHPDVPEVTFTYDSGTNKFTIAEV